MCVKNIFTKTGKINLFFLEKSKIILITVGSPLDTELTLKTKSGGSVPGWRMGYVTYL